MKRPCSCQAVTEFVQNGDPADFLRNVEQMEAYVAEGILELYAANCPADEVPFHVEQEDHYALARNYCCPKCGKGFVVGWCTHGRPMLKEDDEVMHRHYEGFRGEKPVGKYFERPQSILKRIWINMRNGMKIEAEMLRNAQAEKDRKSN